MEFDEKDPVWNLLDHASTKKASGAFVQNTVRAVRQLGDDSQQKRASWFEVLFAKPVLIGVGAAAAVAVAFVMLSGDPTFDEVANQIEVEDEPVEAVYTEEFEVVSYVNELLAVNDPSELDDLALAEVLFGY
ncbi:MAG: hypothetical protein AAF585_11740 [Verrucomicrobiota bacterium]